MQHSANSNNKNGGNAQVQSVIIIAITLFALAGAILGFSLGALTHHAASNSQASNNSKANTNTNKNTKSINAATSPTPTPAAPAQPLGGPVLTVGTPLTGIYKFTYTLQAVSNANAPITTSGVTCRIWLTKADQGKPEIEANDKNEFQHIANVTNPLPHEIANGLTFDNTTPQTQSCKNGLGTWNITLSPSLAKGHYYIVGLTSNGTFFNWSWSSQITVN